MEEMNLLLKHRKRRLPMGGKLPTPTPNVTEVGKYTNKRRKWRLCNLSVICLTHNCLHRLTNSDYGRKVQKLNNERKIYVASRNWATYNREIICITCSFQDFISVLLSDLYRGNFISMKVGKVKATCIICFLFGLYNCITLLK